MGTLILFSFGKITTKVFSRFVRVKYVVCSPTKVVLDLIDLLSSTVWRSALSLALSSACWILSFDLHFSIGKITTLTAALMHSFRVWYVQCLAERLTLNLIELIHLKVWRSLNSLAVKNLLKNWTTTTLAARLQNPTAIVSKLFSDKSNFRSRD